jgi:hypothetical protein
VQMPSIVGPLRMMAVTQLTNERSMAWAHLLGMVSILVLNRSFECTVFGTKIDFNTIFPMHSATVNREGFCSSFNN